MCHALPPAAVAELLQQLTPGQQNFVVLDLSEFEWEMEGPDLWMECSWEDYTTPNSPAELRAELRGTAVVVLSSAGTAARAVSGAVSRVFPARSSQPSGVVSQHAKVQAQQGGGPHKSEEKGQNVEGGAD